MWGAGGSQVLEQESEGLSREEFEGQRDCAVHALSSNDLIGSDRSFGRDRRVGQIQGYAETCE